MWRLIGLQVLATVLVGALAWPWAGVAGGVSALLGGAACVLPNAWFAWRLALTRAGEAASFFVGELIKVLLTVALLALIVWGYEQLVWPAMIAAIIAVLKSYLIVLIWR
ncbi:MAG: ATP synthase subunit I [Sutterellaceae bacterium]|nr:ATP synthase subunit I [Burkholderiaceae bacterium]MCX7900905.1 ATP synthase subunit I [Burkholderiaceae bacterium]MDW8429745.1 ATP synthase subunit I [Sutterellaceae bacterium]